MPAEDGWFAQYPAGITVCDREGRILAMNEAAAENFAEFGGQDLLGKNVLDCHAGPARAKLLAMLAEGATNCYEIEKRGRKKLIYQAPWFERGECCGLVEMIIPLPPELPHFVRD